MSFIHIKGIGPEIWKFVKQVNGISSGNMETFTMMCQIWFGKYCAYDMIMIAYQKYLVYYIIWLKIGGLMW